MGWVGHRLGARLLEGPDQPGARAFQVWSWAARTNDHLNHPVIAMLGSMTQGADRGAGEPPVQWLTAEEVHSWLSVVRLMTWLPWSIDQQLQRGTNPGGGGGQVMGPGAGG